MPTRCSELGPLLLFGAAVAALAGCSKHEPTPLAPPPPPPLSEWPKGVTPPQKVTEQLTLEIPLQYERTAISREQKPLRAFLTQQSDKAEVAFDFFLPGFSGYTLKNYRSDTDPNKVEVVYLHAGDAHEGEPGAPGLYPPNVLQRGLGESLNPGEYLEQHGLRCYQGRPPSPRLTCFGKRDAAGEDIMLTTVQGPYAPDEFPQLQARYYSKQYGGVRIYWRTYVGNLPRWREIDRQIWKFIGEWKVAAPAAAASGAADQAPPRPKGR